MVYAAQTRVPISKTKTDIEELLARHGAVGFGYVTEFSVDCGNFCTRTPGVPVPETTVDEKRLSFGDERQVRCTR